MPRTIIEKLWDNHVVHERPGAIGCRVADCVRNAQAGSADTDRRGKQQPQRLRIGARRVFGDVHDGQAFLHRKRQRVLRALLQIIERPSFRSKKMFPRLTDTDCARMDGIRATVITNAARIALNILRLCYRFLF